MRYGDVDIKMRGEFTDEQFDAAAKLLREKAATLKPGQRIRAYVRGPGGFKDAPELVDLALETEIPPGMEIGVEVERNASEATRRTRESFKAVAKDAMDDAAAEAKRTVLHHEEPVDEKHDEPSVVTGKHKPK